MYRTFVYDYYFARQCTLYITTTLSTENTQICLVNISENILEIANQIEYAQGGCKQHKILTMHTHREGLVCTDT